MRNTPFGTVALVAALTAGCALTGDPQPKPRQHYPSTGKVLYIGSVDDLRPKTRADESDETDDGSNLVSQREVHIPVSEVRSVFADTFAQSGLFERVLSPPNSFLGKTPDAMITQAQESSDYLLVADLNQFHIKSLGFNDLAWLSVPGDILLAPIAFATYLTTGGNMYFFSGSLLACWDAEVMLTMSVSLVDVSTGHVAYTLRLEERVVSAYDGLDAFGSLWDESDDWVDLGRRLGQLALHNASVDLAARLHEALDPDARRETE